MKKVEIYDSTLRDGAQAEAVSFSLTDKISIVQALDLLGVDYIEAGNPASGPKDARLYKELAKLPLACSKIVAFGSTCHSGKSAESDEGLAALLAVDTKQLCIFGKCWDYHVTEILETELAENLRMISDSVRFLTSSGREVFFDAEHFFDGYRSDPRYAISCLRAARSAGATRLVLCDTRGGMLPHEIEEIVKEVCAKFQNVGVHLHNDCGVAVAGSLAAVRAGAMQVQGTLLGFGERAGNANLSTIIPDLALKMGVSTIGGERLKRLTRTSRFVAEVCNLSLSAAKPFVGSSAFSHKAGMHAAAVLKSPMSYEQCDPEVVGGERKILLGEQSGRAALLSKIGRVAPELKKDSPETAELLSELKALDLAGYSFEAAEASFELILRRKKDGKNRFFEVLSYKNTGLFPYSDGLSSESEITVRVGENRKKCVAKGDGPVHAIDRALRGALELFYPNIGEAKLLDYKVRVIEPSDATAAKVRVLIESGDGRRVWSTTGVSADIIEASFLALYDSIEYKLYSDAEEEK